jgi:hypothetical protein
MGEGEIQELLGEILKSVTQDFKEGSNPETFNLAKSTAERILTKKYADGNPVFEGEPPSKFRHGWERKLWEEHMKLRGESLESPPEEPAVSGSESSPGEVESEE